LEDSMLGRRPNFPPQSKNQSTPKCVATCHVELQCKLPVQTDLSDEE
jgi:hypothetical protein